MGSQLANEIRVFALYSRRMPVFARNIIAHRCIHSRENCTLYCVQLLYSSAVIIVHFICVPTQVQL